METKNRKSKYGFKRIGASVLCAVVALVGLSGCNSGSIFRPDEDEKVDTTKSQLYIGNCNGGLGFAWLEEVANAFEEKYAETSFEEGKMGVQVIIDNEVIGTIDGTQLKNNLPASRDDIFFTESVDYPYFVANGSFLEITDVIKEDMAEFGEPGVTVESKIGTYTQNYLKSVDGKYYAIPFYEGLFGFAYDKTLFDKKGIWMQDDVDFSSADLDFDNPDLSQLAVLFGSKANKTAGRDGVKGTYDDGLPVTYEDFIAMCLFMNACGVTPLIWSGAHNDYIGKTFLNVWAQEAGADFLNTWNTLSGTVSDLISIDADGNITELDPVEINNYNAYEMIRSRSFYESLRFSEMFFGNRSFLHTSCLDSSCSHVKAQSQFLYSSVISSSKAIAMFADGSYWTCEARETFNEMAEDGEEYSWKNREIGFMPMPTSIARTDAKNTLISFNEAFVFINAKATGARQELAKKFLQFSSCDEAIFIFSKNTAMTRGLSFTPSAEQREEMSYFANSLWDVRGDAEVVLTLSSNPLVQNRSDFFGLNLGVFTAKYNDGTTGSDAISNFINGKKLSPIAYFNAMYKYRTENYPVTL